MVDNKQQWKAWLYLSPAIVLLLIFTVWPIFNTVRLAFLEGYDTAVELGWFRKGQYRGEPYPFAVGFGNFLTVVKNKEFVTILKNTLLLCVLTVPLSTFIALVIAVSLNSIKFLNRTLQTIYFLPYVTNSIAIGIVFAAMFTMSTVKNNGETIIVTAGIINDIIGIFGVAPVDWLGPQSTYAQNIFVMVVYIVWNALPFKILILLGGLQSVNKQYYDAAKVDGTSKVRTFTRITVPLLSPMIAYVVITGFIGGFKEYTSIVGVFGESMGPTGEAYRLNTMVGYIYKYIARNQGRASAAALILFGIIFVVTLINLKVSSKKTQY
ncbi:MAG: sugar ABC transporter permease [Clostridia bacterium]|nr:sugar ABC transporter permease [Clostridia bacterium]